MQNPVDFEIFMCVCPKKLKMNQEVILIFSLAPEYKALSHVSKQPISFALCRVYKIWPLLKSLPSPLFMFMVGWISNCEIEILKWFRGDPPSLPHSFLFHITKSVWIFADLISDLRKRQVLPGEAINFWLRLATLRKTATEWLVLQYSCCCCSERDNTMKWVVNLRPSLGSLLETDAS